MNFPFLCSNQQHLYMEDIPLSWSGLLLTMKLLNPGVPVFKLKWSLRKFYGRHHDLTITEYLCHTWQLICSICRNHNPSFPHTWSTIRFSTKVTRRVSHVKQELFSLPEHLSSSSFFSRSCNGRSTFLCTVMYIVVCAFSFNQRIVCSSSISGCGVIPLWYLQAFLICIY